MINRPIWHGAARDGVLPFELSSEELAVVLIARAAPSRISVLSKAWLQGVPDAGGPEVRDWLSQAVPAGHDFLEFRLIGGESILREVGPRMGKWLSLDGQVQIPMGKSVTLAGQPGLFHFLPAEGRIRVPRDTQCTAPAPETPAKRAPSPSSSLLRQRRRVLVVDDSDTIRKLLSQIFSRDPGLVFVGSVGHPAQVRQAIIELKPDVITLDIHMPEMNGVELLKKLLPEFHIPAVMISSLSREDGSFVLDALEAGAIDYIQKPSFQELGQLAPVICEKVRNAALAQVQPKSAARRPRSPGTAQGEFDENYLIAIGSSTGGTEALKQVLTGLPERIPPILIVQHIPPVFSKAFADRMNQLCVFDVCEAQDGDEVRPGRVLIAPGGRQMRVRPVGPANQGQLRISIDDSEPVNRHKPSVDALFDSVEKLRRPKVVAAILTGMGADGARGLLRLRQQGVRTIAQDEATCVVFGMPREAIKLGAAEEVLPLDRIADRLLELARRNSRAA